MHADLAWVRAHYECVKLVVSKFVARLIGSEPWRRIDRKKLFCCRTINWTLSSMSTSGKYKIPHKIQEHEQMKTKHGKNYAVHLIASCNILLNIWISEKWLNFNRISWAVLNISYRFGIRYENFGNLKWFLSSKALLLLKFTCTCR